MSEMRRQQNDQLGIATSELSQAAPQPRKKVGCWLRLNEALQRLELYAGKLARTVLRGGWCSNVLSLPDQRYLQPKTMEVYQVGMFDTWAGNFGESVTALELAPDGRGYRMHP